MKTRKLLKMITALFVILSLSTTSLVYADNVSQIIGDSNTVVFIDVPGDYWAKDQIDYFARQGIVDGYADGSFQPEAGVTREEFCKLLVSTFKQPLETPDMPTFSDVNENRWSYPYVEVCREFLTGYANPFGGLPAFHPEEYATREDIAVALVRMMGFTDSDANDKNYASWKFRDGNSISPNLLSYVSIACEKGLISGYPDETFAPTRGITRAETVVLLNRATKQAVTNINAELELSANIIYSKDRKTATINIISEQGAVVTVNGESVKMSNNYYDEYEGNYVYKFEKEGIKDFVIEGKKSGKTKTIQLTGSYESDTPVINTPAYPKTYDYEFITIECSVESAADSNPTVTINGEEAKPKYSGNSFDFSKKVQLEHGVNLIVIKAENKYGKASSQTIKINFEAPAPEIEIYKYPKTAETPYATLYGKVYDENDDDVAVYINDNKISTDEGSWEKSLKLDEGINEITVKAVNRFGVSSIVIKEIIYSSESEDTSNNEIKDNKRDNSEDSSNKYEFEAFNKEFNVDNSYVYIDINRDSDGNIELSSMGSEISYPHKNIVIVVRVYDDADDEFGNIYFEFNNQLIDLYKHDAISYVMNYNNAEDFKVSAYDKVGHSDSSTFSVSVVNYEDDKTGLICTQHS